VSPKVTQTPQFSVSTGLKSGKLIFFSSSVTSSLSDNNSLT